jgi:hypothetical protein
MRFLTIAYFQFMNLLKEFESSLGVLNYLYFGLCSLVNLAYVHVCLVRVYIYFQGRGYSFGITI